MVTTECAMEYTGPVNELKEMCEIRIEVAGILRDCRVSINLVKIQLLVFFKVEVMFIFT